MSIEFPSVVEGVRYCSANLVDANFILVAGPTAAGKTTFAGELAQHLGCGILELDRFYKDQKDVPPVHIEGSLWRQWESPDAFDWDEVERVLGAMRSPGATAELPVFSFEEERRKGYETVGLECYRRNVIIVGIVAFHCPIPRGEPLCRVFVEASSATRKLRRVTRDPVTRRMPEGQKRERLRWRAIQLGEGEWVLPQRDLADCVVCNP